MGNVRNDSNLVTFRVKAAIINLFWIPKKKKISDYQLLAQVEEHHTQQQSQSKNKDFVDYQGKNWCLLFTELF